MFVFFFFKQKTAYEITVRDWSSDVCSSDLEHDLVARLEVVARVELAAQIEALDPVGARNFRRRTQADAEAPRRIEQVVRGVDLRVSGDRGDEEGFGRAEVAGRVAFALARRHQLEP